jgi:HEAT repeat protein
MVSGTLMMMTLFSSPIDSFSQLYRRVISACFPPILQPLPLVSFSANIHPNPLAGSSAFVTMVSHNDSSNTPEEDPTASSSSSSSSEEQSTAMPFNYFDTAALYNSPTWQAASQPKLTELQQLLTTVLQENAPLLERQIALKQAFSMLHKKDVSQQSFWLVPTIIELLKQSTCVPLLTEALKGLGLIKVRSTIPTLIAFAVGSGVQLFDSVMIPLQEDDTAQTAQQRAKAYASLLKEEPIVKLRCQAIRLLGIMEAEEATVPLMTLLHDKSTNYRVRLEVAEALGRLQNTKAVNPLIALLKDEKESSLYVKESAVKALGMLGDIRALEPLLDLFEAQQGFRKKTTFLFEQIVTAIGRLGQQNHPQNAARKKVLASLLKALQDTAPSIRLAAVEALSEVGEQSDLPHLTPLLFDENMDVAHATLVAIYKLGDIDALHTILNQEENLPHYLRSEIQEFLLLEADGNEDDDPFNDDTKPTSL